MCSGARMTSLHCLAYARSCEGVKPGPTNTDVRISAGCAHPVRQEWEESPGVDTPGLLLSRKKVHAEGYSSPQPTYLAILLQASKGTRIRQGAPDEDKALAAHVLELVPKDQLLSEAAHLCELLILLGHEADAGVLQQVGFIAASPLSLCTQATFHATSRNSADVRPCKEKERCRDA